MEEEEEEEEREGEEEEKEAATRGNDSVFTFDFLPLESFSKLKTLPSMEEFLLLFTKFQFFPPILPQNRIFTERQHRLSPLDYRELPTIGNWNEERRNEKERRERKVLRVYRGSHRTGFSRG